MNTIRLQKYMALCGVASRRASEKLIAEGRVKVNGKVITGTGFILNPLTDRVEVDGKLLKVGKNKYYYLLYKTKGTITTLFDPFGRPTVMKALPRTHLFPVGRLDMDAEGLLLITNDGELAYRLTHPRFAVDKMYRVCVKGKPDENKLGHLRQGIKLDNGITSPAKVELVSYFRGKSVLDITISEGKKRQVKRMCLAIGHPVIALKRIAIAFLTLKGLKPGQFRALTRKEVQDLYRLVGLDYKKYIYL